MRKRFRPGSSGPSIPVPPQVTTGHEFVDMIGRRPSPKSRPRKKNDAAEIRARIRGKEGARARPSARGQVPPLPPARRPLAGAM